MELANNTFGHELSNADGGTGGYTPSDQDIKNSQAALQQIIQIKQNRDANTAATGCKKPLINVGKKKEAYEKCLAENKKAQYNAPAPVTNVYNTPAPEQKSFFKTGAGIAVIAIGSIGAIVGTVLLIKHFKK